jgi:RND family efflux transporter MFP subunit
MNRKTFWVLGSAAAALLLWAHEGHHGIAVKGVKIEKGVLTLEEANRKAIGLTHATVDFRTIEETLAVNAVARIPASARAFAGVRLPGVITQVLVRPGASVKAGDVLAEVDSVVLKNLQIEIAQREADLKSAQDNLKLAESSGVVPEMELLPLRVAVEERKNALAGARMQWEAAGASGQSLLVRAPIDGSILHVDLSAGRWVEPMEHLFEVLDLREVGFEAEVPETRLGRIRGGQKARATLSAFAGRAFDGVVQRLGHVDPERHVLSVWITLPNPDGLIRPGMFGRAEIVLDRSEDIFAAPARAILTQGAERFALVQNKDGSYRRANVITGREEGEVVEILEGLYPGDRIVLEGAHELADLFPLEHFTVSAEARKAIGLKTAEIDLRPIEEVVELSARLRLPPENLAAAATRLEARVQKILVSIGEHVEAGQPLVELESLEMQQLQRELIRENLRLKLLQDQLRSLEKLQEKNIAPRKELIRVQSELRAQESTIQNLQGRLAAMGLSVQPGAVVRTLRVPSPLSGHVVDIHAAVGQVVRPGDHLVEVQDRSRLWVEGYAFERDVARVLAAKTAEARILAQPDRWFPVKLVGKGAALGDRVLQIWAEAPVDALPDVMAELSLSSGPAGPPVIAAPREALLEESGKTWAFVGTRDGFVRVPVVPGRRDSHYVEILKGLFPGDRVAVSGLDELNNSHSAAR